MRGGRSRRPFGPRGRLVKYARRGSARMLAVAATLGLLLSVLGVSESSAAAKPKACKKGFVRNKAKKCVKKAAVKTTKKHATATTAKPASSASQRPTDADPNGVVKIGFDLSSGGGLKFDPATMGTGQYIQTLPVLRALMTR